VPDAGVRVEGNVGDLSAMVTAATAEGATKGAAINADLVADEARRAAAKALAAG
jgi:hypothetical protein